MQYKFNSSFFIAKYKYFIFDFDGIIKESVAIKKNIYCDLFSEYKDKLQLIEKHHLKNGGVSRYEKIPIYLKYCNQEVNSDNINYYLKKFSDIATNLVIDSKWVPGFKDFFKKLKHKENIYIVSAAPEKEIQIISNAIGLEIPISNIFGSPNSKTANISSFLRIKNKNDYIFFGDSYSDALAAANCLIDFAYRSYPLNFYKKPDYFTYTFSDFRNEIN